MSELHAYAVGQPYSPIRTRWAEGVEYNYRDGAHELRVFFNHVSEQDVDRIVRGNAEFAVNASASPDIIFFLYHFGDAVPWSDAPYSWYMVPLDQRATLLVLPAGTGVLLSIVLVEAMNGIILGLRTVSLSPHVSRVLHEAITQQIARPFTQTVFDAELARVYATYPDSTDLLRGAVRSHAGD